MYIEGEENAKATFAEKNEKKAWGRGRTFS